MTPRAARRVLLADADAFFVAVARLSDPEGVGREPLLIVGGTRESRGVVCSASYETRRYGVRSAMPIAQALRLCPAAVCVPVPRRACSEMSRAIREVLERFSPVVEAASIDEWYLDLGGTEALYGDEPLAATAMRIRQAVRDATSLSISIGGGTSKLVAKLAVEHAKPRAVAGGNGVHVVQAGSEAVFMRGIKLADISGVGPRFQERLSALGMHTVPDVLQYDRRTLSAYLGTRAADWLARSARGEDDAPVEPRLDSKQISRDETFPEDLREDRDLERELLTLVVRAAADLRAEGIAARTITVRLRDGDFRTRQAGRTLDMPVVSDRAIFHVARALLARLRAARRVPARLIGVALSSLARDSAADQLALFEEPGHGAPETARDRSLARAVDAARARFGDDILLPGAIRDR
ncbi:MAG TPA: DNA polymerase IV [Gemmatimonadaceae bacterium]|nr:DNA polymerase IV [Gemmatimonadaceae bacterium]